MIYINAMNGRPRRPAWLVDPETQHWYWQGAIDPKGYGRKGSPTKTLYAHRFVYELLVGQIPEGLTIDHLCRVRHCVNPDHMEVTTIQVNLARGFGVAANNARRTHCKNGHPFDAVWGARRDRACKRCANERVRAWKAVHAVSTP
jgi:hypothetical protein